MTDGLAGRCSRRHNGNCFRRSRCRPARRCAPGSSGRQQSAWTRWSRTWQWLLPLLYVRLKAAGVAAVRLARYANVYRHNWYKHTVRLGALGPVLAALRAQGAAPVLLGGAALAAAYAPAPGARPFDGVTLTVPALSVAALAEAVCAYEPAVGRGVRWSATAVAEPQAARAAGLALRVPGPAAMLLHILTGAALAEDASPLLWAADAVQVAARLNADGWAALWRQAEAQHLKKR